MQGAPAQWVPSRDPQATLQFPHWALPLTLTPVLPSSPPARENTGPLAISDPGGSRCGLSFPAIQWPVATLFKGWFGAATQVPPTDFLWALQVALSAAQVKSGGPHTLG